MKLKRLLVSVMLVLVMCVSLIGTVASAAEYTPAPMAASSDGEITPMAEETMWYFRNYNGQLQKRLWSITEEKWLTDWINVY